MHGPDDRANPDEGFGDAPLPAVASGQQADPDEDEITSDVTEHSATPDRSDRKP